MGSQDIAKTRTGKSYIPSPRSLFSRAASHTITVLDQDREIDIGRICSTYSDFASYTWTHVCVCFCSSAFSRV